MSADALNRVRHVVQVTERRPWEGPLVERLLRGMLHQQARHAAARLRRDGGELRYHTSGAWEPERKLEQRMSADLCAQLQQLFERAEPSCDRGASRTIELILPDVGPAAFRLHAIGRSEWVITALEHEEARLSIVDSEHARTRRGLYAAGRAELERGAHAAALPSLRQALSMAEELGSEAEQLCILLTIASTYELAGELLRAERTYKDGLRRLEAAYGRDDVQRVALFGRLAHCAETRGDKAVAAMWRDRGRASVL